MNIAICDDDSIIVEQLHKWLDEYFENQKLKKPIIKDYCCGEDLLNDDFVPDIAFLDVEMEGKNGIHTGRDLLKCNRNLIIFIITSYTEFLDEALQYHAFRYFTKPLNKDRVYNNLRQAIKIYTTSNTKILVETKKETLVFLASEIIMFEVKGHVLSVNTKRGQVISIKNMQYWKNNLNMNCFFMTHRSYIVNFEHIIKFDKNIIEMSDGSKAYLTRRKYTEFKRAYLLYLEGTKS